MRSFPCLIPIVPRYTVTTFAPRRPAARTAQLQNGEDRQAEIQTLKQNKDSE